MARVTPVVERSSRIAVVLAGAGARGAYEAGVLSVVLPRMEAAGVRPDLYVGTSAGAMNGALFAATAHLPATEQAESVLETWRSITSADVFRPVLNTALPTAARWAGQLFGVPGARLTSLLDTTPLHATAARLLSWQQLRSNLDDGLAELAVVATASSSNRTVVFVDRGADTVVPAPDRSRAIDYVATKMAAEHVLASAAIPAAFPAVRVDDPAGAQDWYLDGGVRLNAPLKPALALGANALVAVATHPAVYPGAAGPTSEDLGPPDVDDVLVRVMDAALVDRMVEDVRTLARTNELIGAAVRNRPGRRALRVVPYVFVGPKERGSLGAVAARCYDERYGGLPTKWPAMRDLDQRLLGRMLAGDGPRRGDLLSYLLFEPEFMRAAIALGREDAGLVVGPEGSAPVPWRTAALT